MPVQEQRGGIVQVFAGSLAASSSPVGHFSEVFGADFQIHPRTSIEVPLETRYEYAVIVLSGDCSFEGRRLQERALYYLGANRSQASFASDAGGRVLMIGGPPFPETILMWWNFVARTPREIADARRDWEERQRFGEVTGYTGARLAAPSLTNFATPNPVS